MQIKDTACKHTHTKHNARTHSTNRYNFGIVSHFMRPTFAVRRTCNTCSPANWKQNPGSNNSCAHEFLVLVYFYCILLNHLDWLNVKKTHIHIERIYVKFTMWTYVILFSPSIDMSHITAPPKHPGDNRKIRILKLHWCTTSHTIWNTFWNK